MVVLEYLNVDHSLPLGEFGSFFFFFYYLALFMSPFLKMTVGSTPLPRILTNRTAMLEKGQPGS